MTEVSSSKKFPRLKKMLKVLTLLLIVFIIAALIEHYVQYKDPAWPSAVPETAQLDSYLKAQEANIEGITPNTEKTIEWFAESGKKTEYVVVYLHGYSATRQETAPLSSLLAKSLNANAYYTRLAGHGLSDARMIEGTLKAWKHDTLEAYEVAKRLGDKVILVSVSTGSTLSTWLMNELEQNDKTYHVVGQVLISPNFEARDEALYIIDWPFGIGLQIAKLITGKEHHTWEPHNEQQDIYWSNDFHISGLRPLAQLMKEVKSIDKSSISVPSLFIYSTQDEVVSTQGIVDTYKAYGSKTKQLLTYEESSDPSNHVLAGEILSPESVQPLLTMISDFLDENKL